MREAQNSSVTGSSGGRCVPLLLKKGRRVFEEHLPFAPCVLTPSWGSKRRSGALPQHISQSFQPAERSCHTLRPPAQGPLRRLQPSSQIGFGFAVVMLAPLPSAQSQPCEFSSGNRFSKGSLRAEPAEDPRVGLAQRVPGDRLLQGFCQCLGGQRGQGPGAEVVPKS